MSITEARDVELAWLAGLIDGEGCVFIGRRKPRARIRSFTYYLGLKIAMCHEATVERVATLCGVGSRGKMTRPVCNGRECSSSYSWLAISHQALLVLHAVKPFSVTKRYEIELAEEFMSIPVTPFGDKNTPSQGIIAARFSVWDRMRRAKTTFAYKEAHKVVVYG